MRRTITFHELAEQELNDAADYYTSKSDGLGNAFLNEVERAVNQIQQHPESAPFINRLVRRKVVRRFPYSIMYSLKPDRIRTLPLLTKNGVLFIGAVEFDIISQITHKRRDQKCPPSPTIPSPIAPPLRTNTTLSVGSRRSPTSCHGCAMAIRFQ